MPLAQTYLISQVQGTLLGNAPYKLLLESESPDDFLPIEDSELVLDKPTCERHGIVPALELVGSLIVCTLTPRTLKHIQKDQSWRADMSDLHPDDMLIGELLREEVWLQHYTSPFPDNSLEQRVTYFLHIYSYNGEGGSLTLRRCPSYKLIVQLTEEQFKQCTQFPPGTVLTASFALLAPDPNKDQDE